MNELYLVGRYIGESGIGVVWTVEGLFTDTNLADAACLDRNYFIGPLELNKVFTGDREWPGVYYPRAEEEINET